jgi:hypothetical protein
MLRLVRLQWIALAVFVLFAAAACERLESPLAPTSALLDFDIGECESDGVSAGFSASEAESFCAALESTLCSEIMNVWGDAMHDSSRFDVVNDLWMAQHGADPNTAGAWDGATDKFFINSQSTEFPSLIWVTIFEEFAHRNLGMEDPEAAEWAEGGGGCPPGPEEG